MKYKCDQALALLKHDSETSLAALKHRHDPALANHKATLDAAQKLVDYADTITVSMIEAIAKGQVELVIQDELLKQTQVIAKELKYYRRELDETFKAKNDTKAAQTRALERLQRDRSGAGAFRALTNAGFGLNKARVTIPRFYFHCHAHEEHAGADEQRESRNRPAVQRKRS